jgi:hypothetical protein
VAVATTRCDGAQPSLDGPQLPNLGVDFADLGARLGANLHGPSSDVVPRDTRERRDLAKAEPEALRRAGVEAR